MLSPWLTSVQTQCRLATPVAAESAGGYQTFGQIFSCVDARCFPVWGRAPFKHHRILGGHISQRNGVAIAQRLHHDAQRAERRGLLQLAICETHTGCAYRGRYGLSEAHVWEDFRRWCGRLPNTILVWCSRDTLRQALTIHGTFHGVSALQLQTVEGYDLTPTVVRSLFSLTGHYQEPVRHDLACLLEGNLGYLREPAPPPVAAGIVVGSGVPGAPTHFSVSNRFETSLGEAFRIALDRIRRQWDDPPEVAIAIARHPARRHKQDAYLTALRRLHGTVAATLDELGELHRCAVHTLFADKGSGAVTLVRL